MSKGKRVCTKCKQELAIDSFGKSKNGPGGLNYWCKACVKANAEKHRQGLAEMLGKEGYLLKRREYYQSNRQRIQAKRDIRQQLRRRHFTTEALKWRAQHPEKVRVSKKKYRLGNQEKVLTYSRNYHATHKAQRNRNLTRRKAFDPAFKLRERLRSTFADKLRKAIGASSSTTGKVKRHSIMNLVGCSIAELMKHLESQFESGMSWSNWGRGAKCWHIDHIRPISSFDLFDEKHLMECWHFTNLRPLWATENLKKGSKIIAGPALHRDISNPS